MLSFMIVGGLVGSIGAFFTGVLAWPADAAPVTFRFTGEITSVTTTLSSARGFNPGQTFFGTYTFETTTADAIPSSDRGAYRGITAFSVNMAGQAIVPLQPPVGLSDGIFILNNEGAVRDRYSLLSSGSGPEIAGWQFRQMNIDLLDSSQSVFSNDTLPTTPPSLSSFAQRPTSFTFSNRDALGNFRGFGSVDGKLTSLSLVPIPPTLLLFGSGVMVLAALHTIGRRSRGSRTH